MDIFADRPVLVDADPCRLSEESYVGVIDPEEKVRGREIPDRDGSVVGLSERTYANKTELLAANTLAYVDMLRLSTCPKGHVRPSRVRVHEEPVLAES